MLVAPLLDTSRVPLPLREAGSTLMLRRAQLDLELEKLLGEPDDSLEALVLEESAIAREEYRLQRRSDYYSWLQRNLWSGFPASLDSSDALGAFRRFDQDMVPLLVLALRDPHPQVAERAAWYLQFLCIHEILPELPELLSVVRDGHGSVSAEVLSSLHLAGALSPPDHLELLVDLLSRKDERVVRESLWLLSRAGQRAEEAVAAVCDVSKDFQNGKIRLEALLALCAIGDLTSPLCTGAFMRALDDPFRPVRLYAAFVFTDVMSGDTVQRQQGLEMIRRHPDRFQPKAPVTSKRAAYESRSYARLVELSLRRLVESACEREGAECLSPEPTR